MQLKNLARLAVLGAVLDLGVFAFQGYQINVLTNQQNQLSQQQTATRHNSAKNDCWSAVLDNAIKHGRQPSYRTKLLEEAQQCVRLP